MIAAHLLHAMFNPKTVAVIGASIKNNSIGAAVINNLLRAHFVGNVFPVNPKYEAINEILCFKSVKDIPNAIDLAVIVTPAPFVPKIVQQCGEKQIKNIIVISSGFSEANEEGKQLELQIVKLAQQYNLHIIGPNCLGLMRPALGLNVTFDNLIPKPGSLALISQSGAICAAILDWAVKNDIGFSTILSTGNGADVDFGDIVDFLTHDPQTEAILLYIEGIHVPRSFVSSLRAASRVKPVIAIKAGRNTEGSRAVHSHTGAMIGDDDVFDEVLRRAGVIRVQTIDQLFAAARVLSCQRRAKGRRLTIVTNGGGAGVLAADHAAELNLELAKLTEKTISNLDAVLPLQWSHQNPIDIIGDASPERYRNVLRAIINDENSDGLLVILIPVPISEPSETANEVAILAKQTDKPIIACWMGEKSVTDALSIFAYNAIPCFSTPEAAVEAFAYLADHYTNRQLLLQIPEPYTYEFNYDLEKARRIIDVALQENRKLLTGFESKKILGHFGITISESIEVQSIAEALLVTESLKFPIAMKINSPDITHKQDVGGVILNIVDTDGIKSAFKEILANAKKYRPDANLLGVTLEEMYKTSNDRELMIGVIQDKVFGPVISFGLGGSLVEIIKDRALAIPPLNRYMAKRLISQTRAAKWLEAFRHLLPANIEKLVEVLLKISDLVCELPEIQELDINPLILNDKEAIAVDARIVTSPRDKTAKRYSHMAIAPYPTHLICHYQLKDGTDITIRPIRPEDACDEQAFIGCLLPNTQYQRYMGYIHELTPDMLIGITQIDYDRDMALIAVCRNNNQEEIIGLAQYFLYPNCETCELGLVIADNWQGKGIGTKLLNSILAIAKDKGIKTITGIVLANNETMLNLLAEFDFNINKNNDATLCNVTKILL